MSIEVAERRRCSILGASVLLISVPALTLAQYAPIVIHESRRTVVGGAPGRGLIVNQVKCADDKIFFRQLPASSLRGAPIISLSNDGKSSHIFELPADANGELKGLAVRDFVATATIFYLLGNTPDLRTHVLKYLEDGRFDQDIVLDDSSSSAKAVNGDLNASKLGIMPDGRLLIVGVRTRKTEAPGDQSANYHYSPAVELYGQDGHFQSAVSFQHDSLDLNNSNRQNATNFLPLDLSLLAAAPDGIYFGVQGKKLQVYFISASGEISPKFSAEAEKNFRAMNMDVVNGQLLIQWGTSAESGNEATGQDAKAVSKYDVYSLFDGTPLSTYVEDPHLTGIFACFDGRRSFTFISSDQMGQRILKTASP